MSDTVSEPEPKDPGLPTEGQRALRGFLLGAALGAALAALARRGGRGNEG
jgi:hypothetical protein